MIVVFLRKDMGASISGPVHASLTLFIMADIEYDENDVENHHGNERLIRWLIRERFLHNNMICDRCLSPCILQHSPSFSVDHWCWRCTREDCRSKISVRDGSFFANSHLSLRKLIKIAINFVANSSINGTADRLGIHRFTVAEIFKRIKVRYSQDLVTNPITFSHGFEYEVDELYLKHIKVGPDAYTNQWIASILERASGKIIYYRIPDRSSMSLVPPIILLLDAGVFIYSDEWRGYLPLDNLTYVHRSVNHSAREYVRVDNIAGQNFTVSINRTEGENRVVRQKLSNKSTRTEDNVDLVLSEISYRRSGRSLFEPIKV
jgi:hypothetical protein